jgi:phosphoribosylanthranilate isomerase
MTDFNQVQMLDKMQIDFAGFIFYPASPRYAAEKFTAMEIEKISRMRISTVGVFVNASMDHLLNTINTWKLDYVQLHGDESPDYCKQASTHCKVIKAFRVGSDDPLVDMTAGYGHVDSFLFDTKSDLHGGSGVKFDWQQLSVPLSHQYFLSGGIGVEDAEQVFEFSTHEEKMVAVDINSKFETAPGMKDIDKLIQFKKSLNSYAHE